MITLEARAEEHRIDILRTLTDRCPLRAYGLDAESFKRCLPIEGKPGYEENLGGVSFKLLARPAYTIEILYERPGMFAIFVHAETQTNSGVMSITRITVGAIGLRQIPHEVKRVVKVVLQDPA